LDGRIITFRRVAIARQSTEDCVRFKRYITQFLAQQVLKSPNPASILPFRSVKSYDKSNKVFNNRLRIDIINNKRIIRDILLKRPEIAEVINRRRQKTAVFIAVIAFCGLAYYFYGLYLHLVNILNFIKQNFFNYEQGRIN
jgi:hypothetical protein